MLKNSPSLDKVELESQEAVGALGEGQHGLQGSRDPDGDGIQDLGGEDEDGAQCAAWGLGRGDRHLHAVGGGSQQRGAGASTRLPPLLCELELLISLGASEDAERGSRLNVPDPARQSESRAGRQLRLMCCVCVGCVSVLQRPTSQLCQRDQCVVALTGSDVMTWAWE